VDDRARPERVLAQIMDAGDRAWLAERLEPAWRRRQRRDQRNSVIRQIAIHHFSGLTSARGMTAATGNMLRRYAGSAWRFERDRGLPVDPGRARLWHVLTLNRGKPPSATTIRDALADRGRKSKRPLAMPGCTSLPHGAIEDDDRGLHHDDPCGFRRGALPNGYTTRADNDAITRLSRATDQAPARAPF